MRALAVAAAALSVPAAVPAAGETPLVTWGNRAVDTVRCGRGEVANVDPEDRVTASCRTVLVRIASDRTTRAGAQHATIVEPDAHAVGSRIVAVFQAGRFQSGGAAATAFATSGDGGRTWRDGLLPGPAPFGRASDPVIAFDPVRGVWLAATLGVTRNRESGLVITRSADGLEWEQPRVVDRAPGDLAFDKEWITCDAWPQSPRRGTCYIAYTAIREGGIGLRASTDGGLTWSPPVVAAAGRPAEVGAFPVVRPDGTLVLLWAQEQEAIVAARSSDGGATLDAPSPVATFTARRPRGVRTVAIPIADAAPDGTVWVTWQGCRSGDCERNAVLVSSSPEGRSWSPPRSLPLPGREAAYAPALAVDPASGRVGVAAYGATPCPGSCAANAWLLESRTGSEWGAPRRLTAEPMPLAWHAKAMLGAMLGDYVALVYSGGRPVPVLALAQRGRGKGLRQAALAGLRVALPGTP